MRKSSALIGSAIFFFIAPGTVAGFVPWYITGWESAAEAPAIVSAAGMIVVCLGVAGLVESFVRFALEGRGTPAPVAPTTKLVVKGLYRWVRNPMYVSVISLIIGQAMFFASADLVLYAAAAWLGFHLFVVLLEERRLRREFGEEYARYCENVPRWIPRLTPWRPESD